MKKTIKSSGKIKVEKVKKAAEPQPVVEPVQTAKPVDPVRYTYPEGCRFLNGSQIFFVRKAYFEDNTEMRLIYGEQGEQIMMLSSIRQDALDNPKTFKIMES